MVSGWQRWLFSMYARGALVQTVPRRSNSHPYASEFREQETPALANQPLSDELLSVIRV